MGRTVRNRKTTSHKSGGITYRRTTSYGKNGPRTTYSSSNAGITHSSSFGGGKTKRSTTHNSGNGRSTTWTSGGGRKKKSSPVELISVMIFFGIMFVFLGLSK